MIRFFTKRFKTQAKGKLHLLRPAYLCYLLVATFLFTGVTLSSYVTSVTGGDEAAMARFVVEVQQVDKSTVSPDMNSVSGSYQDQVTFSVSNYNDAYTSEVLTQYDVIITLNQPLPDGVTMRIDGKPELQPSNDGKTFTLANAGMLDPAQQMTHNYTLVFTFSESAINASFSDVTAAITVEAEQVD